MQVCPVFEASMSRNAIDAPAFDDATPDARLRYFPVGILPSRVPHRARTLSESGLDCKKLLDNVEGRGKTKAGER